MNPEPTTPTNTPGITPEMKQLQIKVLESLEDIDTMELVEKFHLDVHELVAEEIGRIVARKSFAELLEYL